MSEGLEREADAIAERVGRVSSASVGSGVGGVPATPPASFPAVFRLPMVGHLEGASVIQRREAPMTETAPQTSATSPAPSPPGGGRSYAADTGVAIDVLGASLADSAAHADQSYVQQAAQAEGVDLFVTSLEDMIDQLEQTLGPSQCLRHLTVWNHGSPRGQRIEYDGESWSGFSLAWLQPRPKLPKLGTASRPVLLRRSDGLERLFHRRRLRRRRSPHRASAGRGSHPKHESSTTTGTERQNKRWPRARACTGLSSARSTRRSGPTRCALGSMRSTTCSSSAPTRPTRG